MTDSWGPADSDDWDETSESESVELDHQLDEQLEKSETRRVVTSLPDGRSLVVSGPGAGTAVLPAGDEVDANQARTQRGLATRDQALSGSQPVMIVHCPHADRSLVPRLMGSIVAATGGSVGVAASVRLPSATLTSHAGWLDSCAAASLKIADPAGYLLDGGIVRVKAVSDRSRRWASYLDTDPLEPTSILEAQRRAGANLLLSDGRALNSGSPEKALDKAFAEADDVLAELEAGERLALNLTLTAQWLQNPDLRERLFAELVDKEQFDIWHIRVQWPSSLGTFEQPRDFELLTGYKRLAQLAEDEERILMLPQSGMTGWLQLGFGSVGFGAGQTSSLHAFKEEAQRGGGPMQPIPRYFEPTLLHTVERSVHDALSKQPDYVDCECPFCPSLLSNADWNHKLASLHHLYWMGRLSGTGTARSQSASVRRAVRSAVRAAAKQPLVGTSDPKHLPTWDRLL
ncbi:MAG: hypothetical protein EOP32_32195 [Rhodococcus sp. (in: high G+C Gram-positive bacteria)]|nr:MAG: hypothetical protein EOP32_32195 [Rhodococcus sp. (in: high G+C Gram-positive bacteria)]